MSGSCSQILTGAHPAAESSLSVCRSRTVFASSLAVHHSRFAFGIVECNGHECQKQPSTNIATRARENAISTRLRRFATLTSTRYRRPRRHNSRRRASSGAVSFRAWVDMRARADADEASGTVDGVIRLELHPVLGALPASRHRRPYQASFHSSG